jgi:hypothetical protein
MSFHWGEGPRSVIVCNRSYVFSYVFAFNGFDDLLDSIIVQIGHALGPQGDSRRYEKSSALAWILNATVASGLEAMTSTL